MVHSDVVHVALCHVMRKKLLVVIGAFRQKKKKKLELWLSALLKALIAAASYKTLATTPSQKQLWQTDNNCVPHNKDRYFSFYYKNKEEVHISHKTSLLQSISN